MTTVIKKGGGRQQFSPAKIKKAIKGAAREAKASARTKKELEKVAKEVIAKFRGRKLVKTAEIRRAVLAKLSRKAKAVAAAWKRKEKKKKKEVIKSSDFYSQIT